MLRVSLVEQSPEEVVLKVEGWVCRGNVALLEQEGAGYLGKGEGLVLDLSGVQFIDERGLELLRRWAEEEGVEVRGGSLFVQALLNQYGLG
jgi:anti-anti-sigma regulatory factor